VATALKERLRDTDMVARIGGDEFADIMPYARLELAVMISKGCKNYWANAALTSSAPRTIA
jgi:GGDEF domain-containing protein